MVEMEETSANPKPVCPSWQSKSDDDMDGNDYGDVYNDFEETVSRYWK
jgi:hypothetical protein